MLNFSKTTSRVAILIFSIFTVCSAEIIAQDTKKTLQVSDYEQWENLGFRSTFSPDGNWFFYDIRRNNKVNEIRLHNLKSNSVKILSEGTRAQFSSDNQWLGYFENPSAKAQEKSKSPLKSTFKLLNLAQPDSMEVKDVNAFSFNDDSRFLAMKRVKTKEKKSKGSDLVIRNLATGQEFSFGNVAQYSWKDESSLLAMVIDADGQAGNGVQLFDPTTGSLSVLDSKEAEYSGLRWREDSDDLVVFRDFEDDDYKEASQHILVWKKVSSKKRNVYVFNQTDFEDFPVHHKVITSRSLTWSDNGEYLFFAIKAWEQKSENKEDTDEEKTSFQDFTDEAPALQIWHSKDVKVIPEQKLSAARRRDNQFMSVWHIEKEKFVQLEDELVESLRLQTNQPILLGVDATPYEKDAMFGRGSSDTYAIDIATGTKTKVLTDISTIGSIGPNGKYFPYVKGDDYYIYDLNQKTHLRLTNGDAIFLNYDDDHPTPRKRSYGVIAWEKSGNSFFVNSKYDVWQLAVNGKNNRRITDGKAQEIRHRFSYIDFEDYIDQKSAMYLSTFGYKSKKSGYARIVPGKAVQQLIWEDARVSRLNKAEEAEVYAYSTETFSDSPDFFVTSSTFKDAKQVSETNPFQKDFAWGKSEIVEYTNANGKKLQGALFYPANYEPGKKYPMITYIYELLSDGIHSYSAPSQTNYYSHTVFTQNGYFVLRPDIVFDAGDPGISSVRTMEAAVKAVVEKGLIDEKRVGLVGHSWGGYQAGYAVTQTDIFAASVAGAGLTNLTSMAGMIAWAFGGAPENEHFEVSQERMVVPIFEDVEGYVRNSSVFNVEKLNTPLLFEVGDNDQNVDWRQGIEYYNAARRARKQFVLLVYANEGHGLRAEKNSSDYQYRILKWFGHYLKGEEAESWISQGIPYEDQMKSLKDWKK
ncbi:prolyl oligopeptidase family serine peptidase [Roseivirga sp.]|uniref:S9 family peptidase n=1 Tax=Roseivirga sp. TaxID=1964215 RepID=UPI003B8CD19A